MPSQEMTFDAAPVKQDTAVQNTSGMTFDAAPVKQDTPANQAASQNTPQPGFLQRAGQFGSDLIQGIGEGTISTVASIDELARKHLPEFMTRGSFGFGKPTDIEAERRIAAPDNTTQAVGNVAENIGEFITGDEALKSLSLAERFKLGQQIAKLAESNPRIAQVISHGLTAIRGGTVVTGQQIAHGTSPGQAVKTGAEVAATGGAIGAVGEGLGAAKDAVTSAAKNLLSTKAIQPALQQGIRDLMNGVADDSGVAKPTAQSIRDVVKQTADAVHSKAKSIYADLDEATGGHVQRFSDRLQNIRLQLNALTGTEEDVQKEAALLKAQKETEESMEQAFADAEAQGVPREKVNEARETFKKSQALYDFDAQVKKSVSGMRPGVGDAVQTAKNAAKNPELIDPTKLFNRVNALYDSGRLQEAVGQEGADKLLQHVSDNLVQHKQILSNQAVAKSVGRKFVTGALGAAGAGTLYELAK